MLKVSFKTIIKETRRSLKVSNIEKKQIYECMDSVLLFLKSSPIGENQAKLCSSFLSTFMHLIKSIVKENKIIEEEDEETYSDKFSTLLSFYIDSESKRMQQNIKDQSNAEKTFIDKVAVKCRVYDDKSKLMAVKSIAKFFAKDDSRMFEEVEVGSSLRLAFNKLLKKILNLQATTITTSSMPYYHQILVVWFKIADDKMKERIKKFALDWTIESTENGRLESIRNKVIQLETHNGFNQIPCDQKEDAFEHLKNGSYFLDGLEWLTKLDKIPFSADATVDLTIDSDDSDIEVELPPPPQLIELDDDEHPPQNVSTTNVHNKICIQERRTYINSVTSLNDGEKPLSFLALRRRSVMLLKEERNKLEENRRKSLSESSSSPKRQLRTNLAVSSKLEKLPQVVNDMPKCTVSLMRIPTKEIEKFERGKLKFTFFIRKYGKVKKKRQYTKRATKELPASKIEIQRPQVAKKSCKPNKSSYPDHTKPNLSLLQVLGSTSSTASKKRKGKSRIENKLISNEIKLVNDIDSWLISDHQYTHSPWIEPTPNIEGNSLDIIEKSIENFDNISDNEQLNNVSPIVSTDLLEEILGSRASTYLPDVAASMNNSMNSNVSKSSLSVDTPEVLPKKRKYTKRVEPKLTTYIERPKRIRKIRKFDFD